MFNVKVTIRDITRAIDCTDNMLTNVNVILYETETCNPVLSDHYAQVININEISSFKSAPSHRVYRCLSMDAIPKLSDV